MIHYVRHYAFCIHFFLFYTNANSFPTYHHTMERHIQLLSPLSGALLFFAQKVKIKSTQKFVVSFFSPFEHLVSVVKRSIYSTQREFCFCLEGLLLDCALGQNVETHKGQLISDITFQG